MIPQGYHMGIALTNKLAWNLNHRQRYLTRLVAEKTDVYSTKLSGTLAVLVETCIQCAKFHEKHPTLSYEYRKHYTQYIVLQTFTA